MMPTPQPQMHQSQVQPMPMHHGNMMQPMHNHKPNRGWILAGGVHIVYMVSLLVLSLVYAMFEPAPDWLDDGNFSDQLFYSMSDSTFYLLFPAFVITIVSVLMAIQAGCNKLLVAFLPAVSQLVCTLLWMVIAASLFPEADFSDAWEEIFGEGFFENVIPGLVSHVVLSAGILVLHTVSSSD